MIMESEKIIRVAIFLLFISVRVGYKITLFQLILLGEVNMFLLVISKVTIPLKKITKIRYNKISSYLTLPLL